MRPNGWRGQGMIFGPDATEQFLTTNGLRLVVRAHETPMYRYMRSKEEAGLPMLWEGYSIDHDTAAGRLITVFRCGRWGGRTLKPHGYLVNAQHGCGFPGVL